MSGLFDLGRCDHGQCQERAVGVTEDGDHLCEDHYEVWMEDQTDGHRHPFDIDSDF